MWMQRAALLHKTTCIGEIVFITKLTGNDIHLVTTFSTNLACDPSAYLSGRTECSCTTHVNCKCRRCWAPYHPAAQCSTHEWSCRRLLTHRAYHHARVLLRSHPVSVLWARDKQTGGSTHILWVSCEQGASKKAFWVTSCECPVSEGQASNFESHPDVPFPVLLSTLIRSRFQANPATLLIPIDYSFPFRGGGALRYSVPKWLLFLSYCGEWLSLPA